MIQQMLAIWSLVPLPLLNLAWILKVHGSRTGEARLGEFGALLYWCVRWVQLCGSWNILWHCPSSGWDMCICAKSLSRVRVPVTPWTVAHQAPLPMGLSRQEYWSGVPYPCPSPGIELRFCVSYLGRWVLYRQSHVGSPAVWGWSFSFHLGVFQDAVMVPWPRLSFPMICTGQFAVRTPSS